MKIVTVEQMRALEKEADASGLSYRQMMLNAGREVAFHILARFYDCENRVALGLVGSGNNGGDTLIALTNLVDQGWKAAAYLVKPRAKEDEWLMGFRHRGGMVLPIEMDEGFVKLEEWLEKAGVLLDGVLGTGVHLPLEKNVADVLGFVSAYEERPYTVAVDCPSGVDCESGQVAEQCIPAELTLCMQAVKAGLLRFPAFAYAGEINLAELDFPEDLPTWEKVHDQAMDVFLVSDWLPKRALDAHKGDFGTLMMMAGCENYPGAVLLAGRAAYRMGVGLLRIAIPLSLQLSLAGHLPEATWLPVPEGNGSFCSTSAALIQKNLDKVNACLLGPGLGQGEPVLDFIKKLLETPKLPPMVVDADGLRHLAKIPKWYQKLPKGSVLTPHPGEMSAITGLKVESIQQDRTETARQFAVKWGAVVVLKGALTLVASPAGEVMVVPIATPALAKAGTGDVLAGMLAALLAQGMDSFQAASAAAFIHARAGQLAAEELDTTVSVLASDVIRAIPQVLSLLE
jgi:ADP-dependent NAD(P)H-hydrate dehydratase / NAD(P)H-hydrate epimerase